MKKVRVIGVPEHFNLPWQLALEEGAFSDRGIDLIWEDIPEGTGRMCQMLEEGSADMAIILTEGIIRSISNGNPSTILQVYVASPLLWGIHVAAGSPFSEISQLNNKIAAISRYGSGSHLMTYVLAEQNEWDADHLKFKVVNHLDGAVESLSSATADYFLWERFTTKPIVDSGIFRRLGDCPTPWPCFVIAARKEFVEDQSRTASHILEVINTYSREFREIPSIDRTISNRYDQQLEDVQKWLSMTAWSQKQIDVQTIDNVIDTLYNLKLINNRLHADKLLTNL